MNLLSCPAEVMGERETPYLPLPQGFQAPATRGPPFATLLATLFCPSARQSLSGLPPALAPARLPQAPCACTCSQPPPSGSGHPRALACGSQGLLTLAGTPLPPHSAGGVCVTAVPNTERSRKKVGCVCARVCFVVGECLLLLQLELRVCVHF